MLEQEKMVVVQDQLETQELASGGCLVEVSSVLSLSPLLSLICSEGNSFFAWVFACPKIKTCFLF